MGQRTNNWAGKAWRSNLGRGDREAQGIREDRQARQPCTQTLVFEWPQRMVTFKLTTEGVWFPWEEVAVTVKLGVWEAGLWAGRSLGTTAFPPRGCSSALRGCLPPVDPLPCPHAPVHSPCLACLALAVAFIPLWSSQPHLADQVPRKTL